MNLSENHIGILGVILSFGFLFVDLSLPLGVSAGIPYVAVITLGLIYKSTRLIAIFGALGVLLTITGFLLSPSGGPLWIVLTNRGLAIFVILVIAIFGYRFISKQIQLEKALHRHAEIDSLTEVASRRYLMNELEARTEEACRYKNPLSILLIDVDHFKNINDRYGHITGDEVLKNVAGVCSESIRQSDMIGRYGGEEFLIICPNTGVAKAEELAERIRSCVEKSLISDIKVTISIGVASLNDCATPNLELINTADKGLYMAKKKGRNKVVVGKADMPSLQMAPHPS